MNERKIYRIAEFLADDIESEAGPKVGPPQKAVPVAKGVSAKENDMNKLAVANELLRIAEDLVAIDFPSRDAMDDYMKEHPGSDESKHTYPSLPPQQKAPGDSYSYNVQHSKT